MEAIRALASRALKEREAVNIKVRQPLASLIIPRNPVFSENNVYLGDFLDILKDEVNVKEIKWADTEDLSLDTVITPALEIEGFIRELMRAVQDLRKEKDFSPHDNAKLTFFVDTEVRAQIEQHLGELQGTTNSGEVVFESLGTNTKVIAGRSVSFEIERI